MFLKYNNLRFFAYRTFGFSLLSVFAVCSSVPALSVEVLQLDIFELVSSSS